jgi:REP element-mobilizing transposase RayT
MPNHVHLLVRPLEGSAMREILKAWKGVSARRINEQLGDSGSLWMDESFTHIVRNREKLSRAARYIRENPAKAKLTGSAYSLGSGQAAWFR